MTFFPFQKSSEMHLLKSILFQPKNFHLWLQVSIFLLLSVVLVTCQSQNATDEVVRTDFNQTASGTLRTMRYNDDKVRKLKPKQENIKKVESNSTMAIVSVVVVVAIIVVAAVVAWKFDMYRKCTRQMNRM